MAAINFTPISLYYTTTAAAVPSAGNLVSGELALNITDEKLYFKNAAGTVKLLAANITAIANGGTGQTTAGAAFNALSPITTTGDLILGNGTNSATRLAIGANGYVLTSNGTTASWAASSGGVTTFSAGTTGLTPSTATSGAVTLAGTLAIANGGTGETTRQNAMDALAGAVTSGQYLRGNGTDVVMSAIQVADVPTLNQNTTGTASNVTGVVAVANGGTGTATPSLIAGTNVTISGSFPNQTINASGGGGSGTVTSVAATVPSFLSVTGSPITTSGTLAFSLASTPTNGQLLIGNGTDFSYSTLTAGSNITITNSSGGITIASTGGGGGGSSSPIPKLQSWSIGAM
jgi:hypothetical protein